MFVQPALECIDRWRHQRTQEAGSSLWPLGGRMNISG